MNLGCISGISRVYLGAPVGSAASGDETTSDATAAARAWPHMPDPTGTREATRAAEAAVCGVGR